MKDIKNVSINELFTYDLVSQPSFVESKVIIHHTIKETREQKRKLKINNILKTKNPLI